MEVLKFNG